ncbi:MAG: NAD(P)-dependent alcohol dehydrogenase [Actinomycetota bacterium]
MALAIRAALALGKGEPLAIEDIELDSPERGEVLVRVVASGLCETDIMVRDEWFPVPLPAVLGHEGAGIVEAVGPGVRRVSPGDHVVLAYSTCGRCDPCRRRKAPYCDRMLERNLACRRLDGTTGYRRAGAPIGGHFFGQSSFASHTLVDERSVVVVPRDAPLEILGPLACGVQTGAGAVLYGLRPSARSSIAVFGAGLIGLSAVLAAGVVGCSPIVVVDPNPNRRELALACGATQAVDAATEDVVDAVRELSSGGVDYSVETTGNAEVLRSAVDVTAPFGVCGVIGPAPVGTETVLDVNMLLFGRSVRGIIGGDVDPQRCVPKLVALHQQGRFPFDRLLRHYTFDEINTAVADIAVGDVMKPVIHLAGGQPPAPRL